MPIRSSDSNIAKACCLVRDIALPQNLLFYRTHKKPSKHGSLSTDVVILSRIICASGSVHFARGGKIPNVDHNNPALNPPEVCASILTHVETNPQTRNHLPRASRHHCGRRPSQQEVHQPLRSK